MAVASVLPAMHDCSCITQPMLLSKHNALQPGRSYGTPQRPTGCQCTAQQRQSSARCIRQVHHRQQQLLSASAAVAATMLQSAAAHASDAAGDVASTFEPQFNPGLLIVALFAATPPVLFWGRIFLSAQRRQREIDQEQEAEDQRQKERDELKRKLWGGK